MKKIIMILSMLTIFMINPLQAHAATASIALASTASSVVVGNNASVKVTLNSSEVIGAAQFNVSYDTSKLDFISVDGAGAGATGGSGIVSFAVVYDNTAKKTMTFTINFKTKAVGSTAVTINTSGVVFADENFNEITPTLTNTNINVVAAPTASTNNNLKSLTISPGSISPAFNKNTTSYTASVNYDVNALVVSAVAEDSKAKVAVSGHNALKEGKNTITIVVTAESGAKKTYTLVVTKAVNPNPPIVEPEPTDVTVTINDSLYTVVVNANEIVAPKGYSFSTVVINDQEVLSLKNDLSEVMLVYLKDEQGSKSFYIYDQVNVTFNQILFVSNTTNQYLIITPNIDKVPKGYKEASITINDTDVTVYRANDDDEMVLVYALNPSGEEGIYQYDIVENTYQRYIATKTTSDNSYNIITYVVGAIAIAGLIGFVVFQENQIHKYKELLKRIKTRQDREEEFNNVDSTND